MENRIYLVVTIIGKDGKVQNIFHGEQEAKRCPLVSYYESGSLVIPLWFTSEDKAMLYLDKANLQDWKREFYLIQEFHYNQKERQSQACIVFKVESEDWPSLDEGEIVKDGARAKVRSYFICDKEAADNYVRRFNEDAKNAFELGRVRVKAA